MAKLTALQVMNAVLENIGESQVSGLTGLTGLQLTVWDKITEALQDIVTDENTRWNFLENIGKITLATSSYQYLISTGLTTGTDMMLEDTESFKQADSGYNIKYKTPQEWDKLYPKGITTDMTGYPSEYTKFAGYLVFNKQAASAQNGKYIDFRYWKYPTYYSTSTMTGTGDIPEPFDRTLLVALATLKVLTYLGNEEAAVYKMQVFGDGRDVEGSLNKMKELYSSPRLKPRMTYQF